MNAAEIDYILLTHAHIDHTGLLPMLYANGFRGQVFATKATAELSAIMLRDSAHIQQFEAEWRNRKARRAGKPEVFRWGTLCTSVYDGRCTCGGKASDSL